VAEIFNQAAVLGAEDIAALVDRLTADGHRVIAPVARDGVMTLAEIERADQLPIGWHDDQEAGYYRARQVADDQSWFSYTVPSQPWKRFLQPERSLIVRTRRTEGGWTHDEPPDPAPPLVFFGVRSCDLHAIARLDTVMADDSSYQARRAALVVVAVACTTSSRACFCASMGTGPQPEVLADIVLTETPDGVLARPVSQDGARLLSGLGEQAPITTVAAATEAVAAAAAMQVRALPADHRRLLPAPADDDAWAALAERCVSCGNCTSVCPTCFCTTTEDRTPLGGDEAERWQRWDTCFSLEFSHMHGGGPVRASPSSRYRQWLLHKLDTWHDQFGESGCVGCGRCIVWCPTGIDLTAAVRHQSQAAAT
jgi:ferredoxin